MALKEARRRSTDSQAAHNSRLLGFTVQASTVKLLFEKLLGFANKGKQLAFMH